MCFSSMPKINKDQEAESRDLLGGGGWRECVCVGAEQKPSPFKDRFTEIGTEDTAGGLRNNSVEVSLMS